jgi:transposase-like protein
MGAIVAEVIDTGKRDARGRRRVPPAQRLDYVQSYRESGLSKTAFAKREGLRYSTFCHWVQKAEIRACTIAPIKRAGTE